jgi:hypothetical protein
VRRPYLAVKGIETLSCARVLIRAPLMYQTHLHTWLSDDHILSRITSL